MWTHESFLRVALVILVLVLSANHHLLHRQPKKQRARKPFLFSRLLLALTIWLWTISIALFVIDLDWFEEFTLPLPLWLRWTGVLLMIASALLSHWTYRVLGEYFSKRLELQENHQLITKGPYRFVRHPMYAGFFLCAIGSWLISANAIVAVCVLALVLVFLARMRKEEAMLEKQFGFSYRIYRRRTGMFIPRFDTIMTWSYKPRQT